MSNRTRRWAIALALIVLAIGAIRAAEVVNLAPVVSEMPDVYIGDAENGTGMNVFVMPDAYNLDDYVNDDHTSASAIRWSYTESGSSRVYLINGAKPVDPATDDLVSPSVSKRIDLNYDPLDPTTGTLGNRTITLRDNLRSPIGEAGGKGPYSDRFGSTSSGPSQIIDSCVVTMFASDGSTVSLSNAASFVVYTFDNGNDFLYEFIWDLEYKADFRKQYSGWNYAGPAIGNTSDGLCIMGSRYGSDDGIWEMAHPVLPLNQNAAYEFQATVTTSNTNAYATPLWSIIYDNFSSDGLSGWNEYGGEMFFLDNQGGANSPIAGIGRSEFTMWLMPIPEQTPQFSSSKYGFFWWMFSGGSGMRVMFRMTSLQGNNVGLDPSSVCLQKCKIYARYLSMMVTDEVVYSVDHFVDASKMPNAPGAWGLEVTGQPATATFNTSGSVTIAPTTNWDNGTIIMFRPGDDKIDFLTSPPNYLDNYPIPWVADSLYYIEFLLSAPDAWAEVNGPDVIRVGADVLTGEISNDNFIVPNTPDLSGGAVPSMMRGVSMPRAGTPQKYGCFFYTHSVTKTPIPDGARWRPRFEILTGSQINPMGRTTNKAGLTVHGVTVKKVHFSK